MEANSAGILVSYNGQTLPTAASQLNFFLLGVGLPVYNPTINIPAGTANSTGSIDAYLSIACGANTTSATNTLNLVFSSTCDPAISSTQQITVTCMQPCPTLQWVTPTIATQPMIINSQYMNNQGSTVRACFGHRRARCKQQFMADPSS